MISAWGVDDGVSKSLVGHGPSGPIYRAATTVGAKGLKKVRSEAGILAGHRNPAGKPNKRMRGDLIGGMYRRGAGPKYDEDTAYNMHLVRARLGGATGRDLGKKPNAKVEELHIPNYQNAHPIRWGSKKHGSTYLVGGKKMLDKPGIRTHELEHAKKSSWRLSQIQSDPVKLAREEARADTISGTYKRNGIRSHTFQNRVGARTTDPKKTAARLERAKAKTGSSASFGSVFRESAAQAEHNKASAHHAFRETQNKIDANGKYKASRAAHRTGYKAAAKAGGVVAVGGGGLYAQDRHEKKKR